MLMPKSSRLIALLLVVVAVFGFYISNAGLSPTFASEGDSTEPEDEVPTLESLTERIAGLENQVAELVLQQNEIAAHETAYPIFDAIAAVYLLDQVDIHALYERLNEGEGIMPGDAGPIRRLVPLLSAVEWPSELAEEGSALVETLSQLSVALSDDDLESALPLASAAHDAQHHFSVSVGAWYDRIQMPEEEDPEQADQSDASHGDDSDDDSDSHTHSDDSDSTSHDNDDDDDSNDTHDDGHGHSHGE